MKKYFQIGNEKFYCEPQARHHLEELKLEARQSDEHQVIELWEVSQQEDIFGNVRQIKQLVTRYTHNLPTNGVFRIHDSYDIRRAKKLYCLQKYDFENHCWKNFKMGDSIPDLTYFMSTYSEVM